jgi:hypothetical protein
MRQRYSRLIMSRHGLIDQRSLAFGRDIAGRIAADPSVILLARTMLARWMTAVRPGSVLLCSNGKPPRRAS